MNRTLISPRALALPLERMGLPGRAALAVTLLLLMAAPRGHAQEGAAASAAKSSDRPAAARAPTPTAGDHDAGVKESEPAAARPRPGGSAAPPTPIRRRLTPMAAETARAIEAGQLAVAGLQERFKRATDHATALALQREIERVKLDTEVALLRIQATYARRAGRLQVADELEAAIDRISNPGAYRAASEPGSVRVPRPAPVDGRR